MALIIAIVLIAVLFGRVSYDKLALKAIQVDRRNKDALEARYTNRALEEKIDAIHRSDQWGSQSLKELLNETNLAFEEAKANDPSIEKIDMPDLKDIILANRGFVSSWSWNFGYEEECHATKRKKEAWYNSVNWIYQTLKKTGN